MLLDLEINHSIYCLLCNRIFEHGKNLKKGEPLIVGEPEIQKLEKSGRKVAEF